MAAVTACCDPDVNQTLFSCCDPLLRDARPAQSSTFIHSFIYVHKFAHINLDCSLEPRTPDRRESHPNFLPPTTTVDPRFRRGQGERAEARYRYRVPQRQTPRAHDHTRHIYGINGGKRLEHNTACGTDSRVTTHLADGPQTLHPLHAPSWALTQKRKRYSCHRTATARLDLGMSNGASLRQRLDDPRRKLSTAGSSRLPSQPPTAYKRSCTVQAARLDRAHLRDGSVRHPPVPRTSHDSTVSKTISPSLPPAKHCGLRVEG